MSLLEIQKFNEKKLFKLLKKSIKKIILENGIDPNTKKGNKELDYLLKKIATFNFDSFEQVQSQGEKIGYMIVKISNERGKIALDQGIIQHLILKEDLTLLNEVTKVVSPQIVNSVGEIPAKQVIPTPVAEVEVEEEQINPPVETVKMQQDDEEEEINPTHPVEVEVGEMLDDEAEVKESISTAVVNKEEPAKAVEINTPSNKDLTSISLKDRVGEDIKTAMKAQDKIRLETVRGIKKIILEKEVSVRPSGQENLTPEQEIEVLTQQAKQRRDSIEQYTNAGRNDLADKEAQELAIIETYLPKQLSDEELTAVIDEIVASVGATSSKDLGKVMGVAMKQLKGKADGKKIQELVKNQLS